MSNLLFETFLLFITHKNSESLPFTFYRQEVAAHNSFKRRCNAFFMELVHSLCFAGNKVPDGEVVTKLIGYVICESRPKPVSATQPGQVKRTTTKQLTPLAQIADPTPIFRSFLLQLLLRSK